MRAGELMYRKLIAGIVVVGALLAGTAGHAAAMGVTVSPARATVRLDDTGVSEQVISIRNDYAQPLAFTVQVRGLQLFGDGSFAPSATSEPLLAEHVSVVPQAFRVDPGKSANLTVTIRDFDKLSPGGHYVSILIGEDQSATSGVAIRSAVHVPVYVIKERGAVRSLVVDTIRQDTSVFTAPKSITAEFRNTGNVLVVPHATVRVTDWRGRVVSTGFINTDSTPVLPDKPLVLQAEVTSRSRPWIPGKYTTTVAYRIDQSDTVQTYSKTYIVVPWASIVVAIGGVLLLVSIFAMLWRAVRRMIQPKKTPLPSAVTTKQPKPRKSIDGITPRA